VTPRQWPTSPDLDPAIDPDTVVLPVVEPLVEPPPSPSDVSGNRPSLLVLATITAGGLAVFGVFALLLPSLIGGGSPSAPPVHNAASPAGVTAAPAQDGPSAAAASAPAPSAGPPSATATTVPATVGNPRFEQQVVALINNERRHGHCPALRVDGKLRAAARSHSADMATHNFVGPTGTDGSSALERMQKAGYPQGLSELVARGGDNPQAVVRSWTRDRTDRAELLDCGARAIGVGVAFRGRTAYWTADFGRA
jgi:uncharacterized protein YkwD